jgi:ribosome-associated protein
MTLDYEGILSELTFKTARSSGSGGQHVNKVSTKVVLYFNIVQSQFLTEEQQHLLMEALSTRITKKGILMLSCSETRSQAKNKELVTKRFFDILEEGLKEDKERKPTKIPRAVKQKRLASKRKHAEKKAQRKPPKLN